MKRLKDLLYNTSDILVAILVLCCAVVVITMRVDAIMTYPEKMASTQSTQGGHILTDWPEPDGAIDEDDEDEDDIFDYVGSGDDGASEQPPDEGDGNQPDSSVPVIHSLYIAYGQPVNEIADNLVKLGFFENRQDVFSTLENQNASQKVQAGTFLIPAGSTKEEVIRIITGPAN